MTSVRYQPLLQVLDTDQALASLEPEWDELLAASGSPTVFLTWAWVASWRATLGRDHELRIATARRPDDGELVGMAPLAIGERGGRRIPKHRVLGMVGSGPAAPDHLDMVVRMGHEHVARPLWEAVACGHAWDVVDLDGLRPGSLLSSVALRRSEDRGRFARPSECPALLLPATWEEYEATLGKNLRQNLRRYRRKLDREAGVPVVERMVTDADEVAQTMSALAGLHQDVKQAAGLRGAFAEPNMLAFHQAVARRFYRAGRLRLFRLDVGGEAAAVIYCFRYGDVVSFYQTGYDRRYGRYGPGRRIMAHAIRAAIDEGAAEFDFLRGDESYKQGWGARPRYDDRVIIPATLRGRIVVSSRTAAKRLRSLTNRGR